MRQFNAVTIGAAILVSTLALSGTRSLGDPRVADLVQAGKIRLALFLPLYAKDAATGELRGVTTGIVSIDLMRAFAARLGVELDLTGYPTPPEVVACLKSGTCDVGIMGVTPGRAAEVDLAPPFLQFDYTFLVPAGSSIRNLADADAPGIRIAVVRNHASTLALSRLLSGTESTCWRRRSRKITPDGLPLSASSSKRRKVPASWHSRSSVQACARCRWHLRTSSIECHRDRVSEDANEVIE